MPLLCPPCFKGSPFLPASNCDHHAATTQGRVAVAGSAPALTSQAGIGRMAQPPRGREGASIGEGAGRTGRKTAGGFVQNPST